MSIHINPAHKGRLHQALHIAASKTIPEAKLEQAKHSRSQAVRREATFAENARHWHKK